MPEYKLSLTIPVKVAQGDGGGDGDGGGETTTTPSWLPLAFVGAIILGVSGSSGNRSK